MGKNILILNGSPRPGGNTAALVEAFTEGAQSAGHTVTAFLLDSLNIRGCKGCHGAGQDPRSPCAQKDDMDRIYPVYAQADIVVMASPLYFWNLSGQLRTAVDRLFAPMENGAHRAKKGGVLLMAAGGHDFGLCPDYHSDLMRRMGWRDLGAVLAGGLSGIGGIAGSPKLEEARRLGASIA